MAVYATDPMIVRIVERRIQMGEYVRDCDTCIHRDEPWDDECNGCCKEHSKWEPMVWTLTAEQLGEIEDEFGSAVIRKIREMCE